MENYNLFIGVAAIVLGILITAMRVLGKLENSPKLIKMKQNFGDKTGNILHILGYSVLPIVLGVYLVYESLYLK